MTPDARNIRYMQTVAGVPRVGQHGGKPAWPFHVKLGFRASFLLRAFDFQIPPQKRMKIDAHNQRQK